MLFWREFYYGLVRPRRSDKNGRIWSPFHKLCLPASNWKEGVLAFQNLTVAASLGINWNDASS